MKNILEIWENLALCNISPGNKFYESIFPEFKDIEWNFACYGEIFESFEEFNNFMKV